MSEKSGCPVWLETPTLASCTLDCKVFQTHGGSHSSIDTSLFVIRFGCKCLSTWPHHWLPLEFFPSVKTRERLCGSESLTKASADIGVASKWVNYNAFRSCVCARVCVCVQEKKRVTWWHSGLPQWADSERYFWIQPWTRLYRTCHGPLWTVPTKKKSSSVLFRAVPPVKSFSSCCLINEKKEFFICHNVPLDWNISRQDSPPSSQGSRPSRSPACRDWAPPPSHSGWSAMPKDSFFRQESVSVHRQY